MNPLGSGHGLAWPPLKLTFEAVGLQVVEHGAWTVGGMWPACSWYAVFEKPAA